MRLSRRYYRWLVIGLLGFALSACGSRGSDSEFFTEEVAPKKPKVSNQTELKRNWRVNLGKSIGTGDAILSPALLGDNLYAAATNGTVEKIVASTGKTAWKKQFKKETITAGVGVGGGLVLVATDQGRVYALNQSDGEVSWRVSLSSEILASPVIDGDVVVARTGDGKVFGLAAYDGEVLWTISRQLPRLTLRGESRPLMFGGAVFAGFAGGTLAAVEAKSGRALWDFPISFPRGTSEIDRLADVDTDPLLVGNNIYISSYQEVTHALNIQEQRIDWSVDVSSFNPLAYDAAYLYISDKKGVVHQINRANGTKVWSQDGLRLRDVSAPISVGPYVAVSDGDAGLWVIDKRSGEFIGRHRLGAKAVIGGAIVDGDTIFVMDSDGDLQSLRLQPAS